MNNLQMILPDKSTEIIGANLSLTNEPPLLFIEMVRNKIKSVLLFLHQQITIKGIKIYLYICIRTKDQINPIYPIDRIVIMCADLIDIMIDQNIMKIEINILNKWYLLCRIDETGNIISNELTEYASV